MRRPQFNFWVGKFPWRRDRLPTLLKFSWASLMAQTVKNSPTMQETWVRSLGREDPLEEEMATHSSILAWRIPKSLAGYSPWCQKESDTTEWLRTAHSPLPVYLPTTDSYRQRLFIKFLRFMENPRDGSLVGCRLWGPTELDTTEAT